MTTHIEFRTTDLMKSTYGPVTALCSFDAPHDFAPIAQATCVECQSEFTFIVHEILRTARLEAHAIRRVGSFAEKHPYQCIRCDETFSDWFDLDRHWTATGHA